MDVGKSLVSSNGRFNGESIWAVIQFAETYNPRSRKERYCVAVISFPDAPVIQLSKTTLVPVRRVSSRRETGCRAYSIGIDYDMRTIALFITGFVEKERFSTAQDPRQPSGRWTSILRSTDLCRSMCNLLVVIVLG